MYQNMQLSSVRKDGCSWCLRRLQILSCRANIGWGYFQTRVQLCLESLAWTGLKQVGSQQQHQSWLTSFTKHRPGMKSHIVCVNTFLWVSRPLCPRKFLTLVRLRIEGDYGLESWGSNWGGQCTLCCATCWRIYNSEMYTTFSFIHYVRTAWIWQVNFTGGDNWIEYLACFIEFLLFTAHHAVTTACGRRVLVS